MGLVQVFRVLIESKGGSKGPECPERVGSVCYGPEGLCPQDSLGGLTVGALMVL